MDYPRERAVAVRVSRSYVIEVTFNDGVRREVDIEPLMWGEAFSPLRDPGVFALVAVNPTCGSVCWPTGADLAPEFLYYGADTPYGRVKIDLPEPAATGGKQSTHATRLSSRPKIGR